MAVPVCTVFMLVVIVGMVVAAAAIGAMLVGMRVPMIVRVFLHMQHVTRRLVVVPVIMVGVIMVGVVAMVMATAAVWAVLVACMVMGCMIMMRMTMTVRLGGFIGAALRLERRIDDIDGGPQTARHLFQYRITRDADAVREQLGRDMAIAEVPGETRQMVRVVCINLGDRLLGSDHGDDAAIVQSETVAVLQAGSLNKVEQEHHVALATHGDAAPMAAVMRQYHAVGGARDVPGAGGQKRAGVDHDRLLEAQGGLHLDH